MLSHKEAMAFCKFYTCTQRGPNTAFINAIFPYSPKPISLHHSKEKALSRLGTNEHDLLLTTYLITEDCLIEGALNFPSTQIYTNKVRL